MKTISFKSRRNTQAKGETREIVGAEYHEISPEAMETIKNIWKSILRVESVSSDDNFFGLGGTSLHAMLMASQLEEELSLELSMADFFDDPCLKSINHCVNLVS
ncbi:MAG: phosphopantetheine-binding protein [Exilibacterium sp.]